MTLPTIHMGGTHPDTMYADITGVLEALREAGRKLAGNAPNGRDYPQDFGEAKREHTERMTKLWELIHDYETILEHVVS